MKTVVSPNEAVAQLRFRLLQHRALPDLAATWLVEGLDTPALRQLAGESPDDSDAIHSLWRETCDELGLAPAIDDQRSRLFAARQLLQTWKGGRVSRLQVLDTMHLSDVWDLEHSVLVGSDSPFLGVAVLFYEVYDAGRWRSTPELDVAIDVELERLWALGQPGGVLR